MGTFGDYFERRYNEAFGSQPGAAPTPGATPPVSKTAITPTSLAEEMKVSIENVLGILKALDVKSRKGQITKDSSMPPVIAAKVREYLANTRQPVQAQAPAQQLQRATPAPAPQQAQKPQGIPAMQAVAKLNTAHAAGDKKTMQQWLQLMGNIHANDTVSPEVVARLMPKARPAVEDPWADNPEVQRNYRRRMR